MNMACMTGICVVFLTFLCGSYAQSPPGSPDITSPDIILFGNTVTLTCTVIGGNPVPTVKWLRDDNVIDDSQTSSGDTHVNTYTFVASADEHLEVFECQSENGVLQNPLSRTIFVQVYRTPVTAELNGPTDVMANTQRQWTCTSTGGYPAQTMQMRIGNSVFSNNELSVTTQFDNVAKSYDVTGVLTWSPQLANNGQTLSCDVFHPDTLGANNPQTDSLQLTVRAPLAVNAPLTSYTPTLGQPVTIQCVVTSGTATGIQWVKNNQNVNLAADGRLSGSSPNSPSLQISSVNTGDAGSYICRATDGSNTVSTVPITVTVYIPLALNAPVTSYTPTIGQTLVVNCVVTAGSPTSITWTKNGQTVNINNNARLSGGSSNSPALVISQVQTGDTGSYICQGTDGTTNTQTNPITVNTYVPLALNAPVTSYTPTLGQTLSINCVVTAGSPTSITWTKNGQTVNINNDSRLSGGNENSPPLVISQVQAGDTGTYQCQGNDGTNDAQADPITVNVYVPLALNAPVTSYTPTVGQTVSINCDVTAGAPTSISWTRNGQTVNIGGRFSGSSTSSPALLITSVQLGDAGTYQCQGSDGTTSTQTNPILLNPYDPLGLNAPVTSYTPTVGQTLSINCVVTTGSPTSITWTKNGQTVNIGGRFSGGSPTSPALVISQVQNGDGGTYQCRGTDGTTTTQTNPITVNVYVPLALNAPVTSYTPTRGQTLSINCVVTAGSPTSITWTKNGQTVNIGGRFSGGSPTSPALVVSQVQTGDGGTYQCQGTDGTTTTQANPITVNVYVPLALNAPVTSYTPTLGQTLSINCVVTAGSPTSITWTKNGQTVNIGGRLSGGSQNSPALIISPVQNGDGGTYQCQGTDGTTSTQTNQILVTVYVPLALNAPVTSYTPTLGQTLSINCVVTAGSPTSITWTKNGQTVSIGGRLSGGSQSSPALVISQVQTGDGGTYQCQGTDGTTNTQTNPITVNVYVPLALDSPVTSYTPTAGQTVSLNCVVTAGSPTSITWTKNGQALNPINDARLSGGSSNSPALVISQVQTGDAATYQCQGTDGTTTTQANPITVNVYVPLGVIADITSYTPTTEETVSINCRITSGTPTSITWYKNNQMLNIAGDARLSGATPASPSLEISNVQMSDAGSYECEARDGTQTVRTSTINVAPTLRVITEEIIINDVLDGYNKLVRPTTFPDIDHSLHPTRIVECDGNTLVLQGYTCMYWTDERLSWTRGQDSISLPSSYIWVPDVTQEGEKPDFYKAPVWPADKVVVTKAGRVSFCPQGLFTAHNCVEKAGEKHECSMKFRSWTYDKNLMDITLPTGRESVDLSGLEDHDTCQITHKCAVRNERTYACCGNRLYPDITYSLVWERRRNYCVDYTQQPTCNS